MTNRVKTGILSVFLVGAAFAWAYGAVVLNLIRTWAADENYSHGFVVLPIVALIGWQRRARLRDAGRRPSVVGLLAILVGLGMLTIGLLGAEVFLARLSMVAVIAGLVVFLLGWEHLAILAFPLALVLLVIPLPTILFNEVAFPLQILASRLGEALLSLGGVPVLREGNVLTLPHARLEVAEACSGIRSLVSLGSLAIIYAYFADSRAWVRAVLAAVAVPVAIAVNGLRIAGTGLLAQAWGVQAAEGFFHAFSGWLMFLAAFALLVGVHRGLVAAIPGNRRTTPATEDSPSC